MRVLLWGELFWPYIGGAELFAARLSISLRERGYEIAVVTSHGGDDLPDEDLYRGIPVYRFPFRRALAPSRLDEMMSLRRRSKALVGELAPDVVHLNGVTLNSFFCLGAVPTAVPLLVRVNREHPPERTRRDTPTLQQRVLERASWVACVSAAVLEQARTIAPAITPRSSLVYSGIEVAPQPPPAPPADPPHVLCLGRLAPEKGFDVAVEALPAILARWPRLRVTFAGDGAERAALEARVRALGLAGAVEFAGWVAPDAVPALITSATLLLMPSRAEGLPLVGLQAAALGRPVVATAAGGLAEIVLDGETGLVVEPTPAAIAGAVDALLDRPEEARRLGLAAWRRAREVFGHERCVDAFDALYRRLAAAAA